jgi:hypothetical protein
MEDIKIEMIYCVRCRKEVKIENPKVITMKSNRRALTGECPNCGIVTYRIISSK